LAPKSLKHLLQYIVDVALEAM